VTCGAYPCPGFGLQQKQNREARLGERFFDQQRLPKTIGRKDWGDGCFLGPRVSLAANMERTLETLDHIGSRRSYRQRSVRSGQSR
jgi:hypothetical protein